MHCHDGPAKAGQSAEMKNFYKGKIGDGATSAMTGTKTANDEIP